MFRLLAHLVAAYLPLAGRHILVEDMEVPAAAGELPHDAGASGHDVVLLA
jgi:hypothetical protein